MKLSLKGYTAYSIGCAVVWAVILAFVASEASEAKAHTVVLVFLGWVIGWLSATTNSLYRIAGAGVNVALMKREFSSTMGSYSDNTPKRVDTQSCIITYHLSAPMRSVPALNGGRIMKDVNPRSRLAVMASSGALALLVASWTLPARGDGTVAYSGFVGGWLQSAGLDFDSDGTDELGFHADFAWTPVPGNPGFYAITSATYSVSCSVPTSILTDGTQLQLVSAGTQLGPSVPPGSWSPPLSTLLVMLQTQATPGPPYGNLEQSGPLADAGIGFLSFRWERPDGWHYGWVRLSNEQVSEDPTRFNLLPMFVDWAYEMRSDVPIEAGAIPEPATWSFVLGGGLVMACLRRRTQDG
jgi:hypothetical protein